MVSAFGFDDGLVLTADHVDPTGWDAGFQTEGTSALILENFPKISTNAVFAPMGQKLLVKLLEI